MCLKFSKDIKKIYKLIRKTRKKNVDCDSASEFKKKHQKQLNYTKVNYIQTSIIPPHKKKQTHPTQKIKPHKNKNQTNKTTHRHCAGACSAGVSVTLASVALLSRSTRAALGTTPARTTTTLRRLPRLVPHTRPPPKPRKPSEVPPEADWGVGGSRGTPPLEGNPQKFRRFAEVHRRHGCWRLLIWSWCDKVGADFLVFWCFC